VLLCSELKFLELWLNQKRFALVVRALAVKSQSVLLRTWTLRSDTAVEPVYNQNRTKQGSRANCQRWGALVCIDHFQVFCNDYSHPWNTNLGWFLPRQEWWSRSPRWKSPDVMVSVNSGENHPTLWLEWVFLFPCWCLDIVKIDKTPLIYNFQIPIWGAWCIVWVGLAHQIPLWRRDWPYVRH